MRLEALEPPTNNNTFSGYSHRNNNNTLARTEPPDNNNNTFSRLSRCNDNNTLVARATK